jgi:hypothetical protein
VHEVRRRVEVLPHDPVGKSPATASMRGFEAEIAP